MRLTIDRWVALFMLAFSVGYGYLAWVHPLLPFEARMPFKPNTLPLGLAVLGVVFSLATLMFESGEELADDVKDWRIFDWKRTAALIGLMVAYALLLRPLGYVPATSLFLIIGGLVLGERNYALLTFVAVAVSVSTWYLVQQVLGIYLVPWPAFVGGA